MNRMIRILIVLPLAIGLVSLILTTRSSRRLSDDVRQLEAELGRISIDDENKVYFVAIKDPVIPPEVASHVECVWQFRCYFPAGYDYVKFMGNGRMTDAGVYVDGGFSSGWSSPDTKAVQERLTISLRRSGQSIESFFTLGGHTTTTSWNEVSATDLNSDEWVIQTLVTPGGSARSFDDDTILPILKIYDRTTKEEKQINGEATITYQGGLVVLCPKSQEAAFEKLHHGKQADNFEASQLAEGQRQ